MLPARACINCGRAGFATGVAVGWHVCVCVLGLRRFGLLQGLTVGPEPSCQACQMSRSAKHVLKRRIHRMCGPQVSGSILP